MKNINNKKLKFPEDPDKNRCEYTLKGFGRLAMRVCFFVCCMFNKHTALLFLSLLIPISMCQRIYNSVIYYTNFNLDNILFIEVLAIRFITICCILSLTSIIYSLLVLIPNTIIKIYDEIKNHYTKLYRRVYFYKVKFPEDPDKHHGDPRYVRHDSMEQLESMQRTDRILLVVSIVLLMTLFTGILLRE